MMVNVKLCTKDDVLNHMVLIKKSRENRSSTKQSLMILNKQDLS